MKRTLFLTLALAACMFNAEAAVTVSGADNTYVYNGNDYIAVNTKADSTTTTVTFNLAKAVQYVASDAYDSSSYLLGWNSNVGSSYGLIVMSDGSGGVQISAAIFGEVWNHVNNQTISYETLNTIKDASGNVTLSIQNTKSSGVTASYAGGTTTWTGLQYSTYATTYGYRTNDAYVTSVTLQTDGTQLETPYVSPYESQRTDNSSVGRILFAGDSITHGINEATWRWQLFKTLTDNGVENEIAGPRSQFEPNYSNSATRDAGGNLAEYSYGGTTFENDHLAKASGRVRDILAGVQIQSGAGALYGGGQNSAANTTAMYNYDTVVCLMGTNDLLSDAGYSSDDFKNKITALLGGSVEYDAETHAYNWTCTKTGNWGNMGKLVADLLPDKNDELYLLNIPVFSIHNNVDKFDSGDGYSEIRNAVSQYNEHYKTWVASYNQAHGTNIKLIDINRGLLDVTRGEFYGHEQFFRLTNGGDGIHPSEQGSLIIAGNIAQGMNIGGRTAGLARASAAGWESAVVGELAAGAVVLYGENAFTMEDGYTVDFSAVFGNGATEGWLAAENALSISIGDGTNSGTLNLCEGYIMWGSDVLFCQDNSASGLDALRVVWHNGNEADNVLKGYYVWLGDMLIGQGLSATTGKGLNGILLNAAGASGSLTGLSWTDTAYAPTTLGMMSAKNAYITQQDAAAVSEFVAHGGGVDFTNATETAAPAGHILVTDSTTSDDRMYNLTSGAGWIGLTNCSHRGDISVQVTGDTVHTVFGSMNGADAGKLLVQVAEGATVGNGTYDNVTAAIAGSYGGGSAEQFSVCVNGGTVSGDIVGGSINENGKIGSAVISVNSGTVEGQIVAGSKIAAAAAAVDYSVVTVTGGTIKRGIAKGNAGYVSVSILGNAANIDGNIEADKVTLRNVSADSTDGGFDAYSGAIKASVVVLDNVQNNIQATLEGVKSIAAINRTNAELTTGETMALDSLELEGDTTLGLFKSADDHTVSSASETTVTISGVLSVGGSDATLNANLVMASGSVLELAGNSLQLGSSLTLGGVLLDDVTVQNILSLEAGTAVTLFTGVDELILDGVGYTHELETSASVAFSNTELSNGRYRLVYNGAADGEVSVMSVPEPTTATLSLLALAALAARRRRSAH